MKSFRCLVGVCLAGLCTLGFGSEKMDVERNPAPALIAKGEGFFIHGFSGRVAPLRKFYSQNVDQSGWVLSHTDTATGELRWLVRSGVRSIPTARISFMESRILGVCQSDTELAVLLYSSGRVWDRPPNGQIPEHASFWG